MRKKRLIKEGSPCDTDFTDKQIQSVSDARRKGRVLCPYYEECQRLKRRQLGRSDSLQCYRQLAKEMATNILDRTSPFEQAVQEEKNEFLREAPNGNFVVCREGKWQIVEGKANAVDDIVTFALVIINRQPGDRRPFTQDGMRTPEMGPSDAIHNALLDLDDVYGEVGQKSPFD